MSNIPRLERTLKFLELKLENRAESLYRARDEVSDYYHETKADVFKEICTVINNELERIGCPI